MTLTVHFDIEKILKREKNKKVSNKTTMLYNETLHYYLF